MTDTSMKAWGLAASGLGLGILLGLALAPGSAVAPADPATRGLDANLWMQTSAEYAACCRQTYELAARRLTERVAARQKTAADPNKKPAVVLDLDETVLDNSPYQTYLLQNGLTFSRESWDRWEGDYPNDDLLVPGSLEFINHAHRAGVVSVYISNRLTKFKDQTIQALKHLKINTDDIDERLMLTSSPEESNKEPRRERARKMYDVLMYIGDNLRDLSEDFRAPGGVDTNDPAALRAAIRDRREKVARRADRFGAEWFLLPNPVYGEWMKLVGRRPLEVLNPTPLRKK